MSCTRAAREPKVYCWRVVDAVEASTLPSVARHLMVTMCGQLRDDGIHTGELGKFSPSLSLLADLTGWKLTPVKKYLGELERLGWLIRVRPPVELQRSEKARTSYTVRIPGEPPDLTASSGPPDDLESEPARSPRGHASGRRPDSAKSPKSRPASNRTGKRGTPSPAPADEILRRRDWCRDCGFELDRVLADAGIQVHPGCADPVADTPTPSISTTTRRPS